MTKKTILIIGSVTCFIVGIIGIVNFLPYYKEINEFGKAVSGIEDLKSKESKFDKKPTIELAFFLMDKYKHVEPIKDLGKVIYYGQEALRLGADDMACGFFVNIWLASTYHEKGDKNNACIFLNKAAKRQDAEKNNLINEKLLQEEGLGIDFAKTCQALKNAGSK